MIFFLLVVKFTNWTDTIREGSRPPPPHSGRNIPDQTSTVSQTAPTADCYGCCLEGRNYTREWSRASIFTFEHNIFRNSRMMHTTQAMHA